MFIPACLLVGAAVAGYLSLALLARRGPHRVRGTARAALRTVGGLAGLVLGAGRCVGPGRSGGTTDGDGGAGG